MHTPSDVSQEFLRMRRNEEQGDLNGVQQLIPVAW